MSNFQLSTLSNNRIFSTVARLKKSSLNYGPNGKSKGSGEVIFYNRADALAAMREYSGMKLDNRELQLNHRRLERQFGAVTDPSAIIRSQCLESAATRATRTWQSCRPAHG